jgi:hypothetical protein
MRSMARWRKRWKVVLMNLSATQSSGSASGNGFQSVASTQDYQEGPRTFIEKRPPVWQGK